MLKKTIWVTDPENPYVIENESRAELYKSIGWILRILSGALTFHTFYAVAFGFEYSWSWTNFGVGLATLTIPLVLEVVGTGSALDDVLRSILRKEISKNLSSFLINLALVLVLGAVNVYTTFKSGELIVLKAKKEVMIDNLDDMSKEGERLTAESFHASSSNNESRAAILSSQAEELKILDETYKATMKSWETNWTPSDKRSEVTKAYEKKREAIITRYEKQLEAVNSDTTTIVSNMEGLKELGDMKLGFLVEIETLTTLLITGLMGGIFIFSLYQQSYYIAADAKPVVSNQNQLMIIVWPILIFRFIGYWFYKAAKMVPDYVKEDREGIL